jgi:hypothetical protein
MKDKDIPEAFRSVIRLGPAKRAFRVGRWAAAERIASAAGVVLILLFMLLSGIVFLFFSGDDSGMAIFGSLAAIAVALLSLYFLWKPFQRAARTLRAEAVLYQGGIAVSYGGDPPRALAWDDIRQVTARIVQHRIWGFLPAGREHRLTISDGGPEPVELDSPLDGIDELYQALRTNASPRIAAEALARFREGKPVEFGPIRANRVEGLSLKNRTLAWNSIRRIEWRDRIFYIRPKSGSLFGILMFEDGSIPNVDALLEICREARVTLKM